MPTQNPLATVFRQPGDRCISSNQYVVGGAILYVVVALGARIMLEDSKTFFMAPLVGFLAFRYAFNKTEKIYFFVQRDGKNNLSYGYMDSDKQRKGDLPIEEWTHWYHEYGISVGKVKSYMLYVSINNGYETVYLKEELKSTAPPENWPHSEDKQDNKTGVFLVPGLRTLVNELDKVSVEEQREYQTAAQ